MLSLPARDLRAKLMQFRRGRQLAQTEQSLHGEFIGGFRAPIEGFRRPRPAARLGEDLQIMTTGKLALRRVSFAVGRGQCALLRIFRRGPVGVPGLSIDIGQRGVDAVQVRQLFGRFIEEEKSAAKLAALHAGLGYQRRYVRRRGVGLLQLFEGRCGYRLIGHAQAIHGARVACDGIGELAVFHAGLVEALGCQECTGQQTARFMIARIGVDGLTQGRDRFGGLIQSQARRAERNQRGQGIGLNLENSFESGDGFALVAGHVLRQPQVQQQARIPRLRLHHLPVDGNGFLVAAGGHQLPGLREPGGQILGLPVEKLRRKKK